MKWVIDVNPRPEQVESLLSQMTPNTSPDLLAQLFSKDHSAEKDFAAGLTLLEQCAKDPNVAEEYGLSTEEMRARLVANVDVIFKYITLRIGMSSTTITVKCLDLIDQLIPVLDAEGHKLSDYETSALLLSLINKVGSIVSVLVAHCSQSLCLAGRRREGDDPSTRPNAVQVLLQRVPLLQGLCDDSRAWSRLQELSHTRRVRRRAGQPLPATWSFSLSRRQSSPSHRQAHQRSRRGRQGRSVDRDRIGVHPRRCG